VKDLYKGHLRRRLKKRSLEDPAVIERILAHLKGKESSSELAMLPEGRAPPQARLGAPALRLTP
jgi:hypothetical protein